MGCNGFYMGRLLIVGNWELNNLEMWNYAYFFLMVVNLSGIYFMTTLVLPKATESGNVDLKKHYFLEYFL